MQNFNFLKAFCLETATSCLPFFKKPTLTPYESVDNSDITQWNAVEEKQKLKNDMFNDPPHKAPIELNTMITNNSEDAPANRVPKNTEKNKLIGNINEDFIKKLEVTHANEPDYFQSMNLNSNEQSVTFNNVVNSQNPKVTKANLDKGFNEKFKLDDNIEPGGNWLDEQDITL